MNYYPFNVGDYAAHTGHLEPMEDLIYRRLLDAYYLREAPLPADVMVTAKLIRLRSMAGDVDAILREFFELTEDGWRHHRCDKEIARMQDKQAKARDAAEQSVKSRRAKAERASSTPAERTLSETPTDAERTLPKEPTDVELPIPTPTPRDRKPSVSSARGARIPPDWDPGETGLAFAATQGLTNGRVQTELAKFRDFWSAKTGPDAVKADWPATWRNWIRRVVEVQPAQRAQAPPTRAEQRVIDSSPSLVAPHLRQYVTPPREVFDAEPPALAKRLG